MQNKSLFNNLLKELFKKCNYFENCLGKTCVVQFSGTGH